MAPGARTKVTRAVRSAPRGGGFGEGATGSFQQLLKYKSPWPARGSLDMAQARWAERGGAVGEGRPVHKGPARRAAFPPLTLGPRLHPSPAAREEGWRGASGVLAGLWLDLGAAKVPGWRWGRRKGHIKEEGGRKKKRESGTSARSAETRTANSSRSRSERLAKVAKNGNWKDGPSPQEWPFGWPSPHPFPLPPTPAEADREERIAPAPRGQTAAGSAAPAPAPRGQLLH